MARDEAGIRALRPRRRERAARVQDRWGAMGSTEAELIREDEELNRATIKRIVQVEAERSLPILEQAAEDAEHGQRLRSMAAFSGDPELELELGAVLRRLATAAGSPKLAGRAW